MPTFSTLDDVKDFKSYKSVTKTALPTLSGRAAVMTPPLSPNARLASDVFAEVATRSTATPR